MRGRRCGVILLVYVMAAAAPTLTGQRREQQGSPSPEVALAKQQPYTAEFRLESVNLMADGTTSAHKSTYLMASDAHDRRLGLTVHFPASGKGNPLTQGVISDREHGTSMRWSSDGNLVVVGEWPPAERRYGCWQTDDGLLRVGFGFRAPPDVNLLPADEPSADAPTDDAEAARDKSGPVREDLGFKTIAGVEAHGERWIWPLSKQDGGDDRRAFVTSERWVAIGSGLMVRQFVEYPEKPGRTRTYSQDLVKYTTGEPNAKTFEPPEGYEVVTEEMHEAPCGRLSWPLP